MRRRRGRRTTCDATWRARVTRALGRGSVLTSELSFGGRRPLRGIASSREQGSQFSGRLTASILNEQKNLEERAAADII